MSYFILGKVICIEGFDSKILDWLYIAQRGFFMLSAPRKGAVWLLAALSRKHSFNPKGSIIFLPAMSAIRPAACLSTLETVGCYRIPRSILYEMFNEACSRGEHLLSLESTLVLIKIHSKHIFTTGDQNPEETSKCVLFHCHPGGALQKLT